MHSSHSEYNWKIEVFSSLSCWSNSRSEARYKQDTNEKIYKDHLVWSASIIIAFIPCTYYALESSIWKLWFANW